MAATLSTLVDNVAIYATTTGTGAIGVGAAVAGYRGIEALTDGSTYSYGIKQDSTFEVGRATYLAASKTLVRSPLFSSNGNAAIDLSQNAIVSMVILAEDVYGAAQTQAVQQTIAGLNNFYPNIASGLAATKPGQFFSVPMTDGSVALYSNQNGSAVLFATYATKAQVDAAVASAIASAASASTYLSQTIVAAATAGVYPISAATTVPSGVASGSGYWVQSSDKLTIDRYINNAGTPQRDTSISSLPTSIFSYSLSDKIGGASNYSYIDIGNPIIAGSAAPAGNLWVDTVNPMPNDGPVTALKINAIGGAATLCLPVLMLAYGVLSRRFHKR